MKQRFCYVNETHRRWLGIEPQGMINKRLIEVAMRAQAMQRYRSFGASMDERAHARRSIEGALYNALSMHQLSLHYQPKFDAQTGRIVRAEALLRWHVDGQQLYKPDQFIPAAESSGSILPTGAWVLPQASMQAQAWQRLGHAIPVSVNVSPLQFQHPDFYHLLDEVLEQYGLATDLLELELTERMVMSGGDSTTRLLHRISQRGIRLSLDDFGTGYCSLSYLKHFPIDALKIDRMFVRDLPQDRDTATITRAIIAMARSLGKVVIAEGVETAAQREFLREAGCTQLQGYLLGMPMPVSELQKHFAPVA